MQYGFIIPGGTVGHILDMAELAEASGWDGVFYWDGICIDGIGTTPVFDPWVMLGAMALRTHRVRIGAIVTPLSRRRPWKVARETVTVDHLSQGRLILAVGLGALDDGGFGKVGEVTDKKVRAELLDESLTIISGLWSGEPFSFTGKHYTVGEMAFQPPPIQSPRIPIWVVGAWPRQRSLQRAFRWDGILPQALTDDGQNRPVIPADITAIRDAAQSARNGLPPLAIPVEGQTRGNDAEGDRSIVEPFRLAGATWWLESRWNAMDQPDIVRDRIALGPPRS